MPARKNPPDDPLSAYRAKRSADRTREPAGAPVPAEEAARPLAAGRFVVHKHAARRLHFDLRLEMEGVLRSWAVPKGPSRNPADKRLAVHVEDHPLEYGDFEGKIAEGNYGAGAVIVWDRGVWVPLEDPIEGLKNGKLLFELRGYKLKGRWTLVKIKKGVKEWLFIKERDAYVSTNGDQFPEGSVLSGLTVEDLRDGKDPAAALRAELKRLGGPARRVKAEDVEPMLAETAERPFSRKGWLFEVKLDGYRMRAVQEGGRGRARLITRRGNDATAAFPELVRPLEALPYEGLIMDGEVVVLDETGRPSFQRLQNRARVSGALPVKRASVNDPATLYLFDLIAVEGFDVRPLPLEKRKAMLRKILPEAGPLRYSEHFATDGEALYEQAVAMGLEGIVAKKADSKYRSGRSSDWLKVRAERTDDFVVVGYTAPRGSRGGFGALHLAWYDDGKLVYAGRAGSGFTAAELKEIAAQLEPLRRSTPPCGGPVPKGAEHVWVEPKLVAEVRYLEWTDEGLLRQPVFVRFREDKKPEECVKQGTGKREEGGEEPELGGPPSPTPDAPRPTPAFTNLAKVFWPEDGYTKGDLIEYYRAIAPWMLPYLTERPLVLTRFPDGIHGKSFFQKDAPEYAQEFVRTVTIWSEDSQRELDYFVCDDVASLLYIANMGAILLHVWSSRVATLETPDWCILDLDPKDAPFTDVVTVANALKALCDDIGLPAYVKTSGSTGLHVLIPLGRQCIYEQSRKLAGLLARVVASELPEIATIMRQVQKRGGKVYVDYVQNGHGRLIVAPYSVRPLPGAPVSMPLDWREVTPALDIRAFTIKNAPERMKALGRDPLVPVLEEKPDLVGALEKLQGRL
jgi:bifunctional non-homologous end joining protein LigD